MIALALGFLPAFAFASPEANIDIVSDVSNIEIRFTGSGAGTGCKSNERFDIEKNGKCVVEYLIGTTSSTASCPSGYTGSRTTTVSTYGWKNVVGKGRVVSRTSSSTTGSCTPIPPPPTGGGGGGGGSAPAPGTKQNISLNNELICGSSNADYSAGPAPNNIKNNIISTYRSMNSLGRCPERSGYVFWQEDYMYYTGQNWVETRKNIVRGSNDATIALSITIANSMCKSSASKYVSHPFVTATYRMGSGNGCEVTF